MTGLRVGAAKQQITPGWPIALDGFAHRTALATWANQPLHVRVAVVQSVDGPATGTAVIVSADILDWDPGVVTELRPRLAQRAGTTPDMVLLSATHTHSAPLTGRGLPDGNGAADPRFITLLQDRTLDALDEALDGLAPVRARRGATTYPLGKYRRVIREGKMTLGLNTEGPVDHDLTIVAFEGEHGLKAALVHYTCHPVISDRAEISGEYPGVAMGEIERATGGTALFLQGCCGDIDPDFTGTARVRRGTDADIVQTGETMARLALGVIEQADQTLAPARVRARESTVDLGFGHLPTSADLHRDERDEGLAGRRARMFLAHPDLLRPADTLTLQRLDLAQGLSLLAMNGEIVVEYGLHARRVSHGAVLPMGYSNGMVGYVPTATQIVEGGYEGVEAALRAYKPSAYSTDIEARVRAGIEQVLAPVPVR